MHNQKSDEINLGMYGNVKYNPIGSDTSYKFDYDNEYIKLAGGTKAHMTALKKEWTQEQKQEKEQHPVLSEIRI